MKRAISLLFACILICSGVISAFAYEDSIEEHGIIPIEEVSASSELVEDGLKYSVENAVDGNTGTCWVEGSEEYGIGESITLFLRGTYDIARISIYSGWTISKDLFDHNAKPRELKVYVSSSPEKARYITLENTSSVQDFEVDYKDVGWITFEIKDVYKGAKNVFDTCISEILLYGTESVDDPEELPVSMFETGESLDAEGNYEDAFKWFKMSAESGYAPAQNIVGTYYLQGLAVTKNVGIAVKWYEKATKQDYPEAQYNLGSLYETGVGVQKSNEKALELYERAARQGYASAQYRAGVFYDQGIGVSQDFIEAFRWYKLAAEQDNPDAQLQLGRFYEYGYGVNPNYQEAAWWYKKSADQGNPEAQYYLGKYYEAYEDYPDAAVWYAAAAFQGSADAQCSLGVLYRQGNGVEQDDKKAVELFSKAAEQGHAKAEYWMGVVYLNGYGVEQNVSTATEWLEAAAENGATEARQLLKDYFNAL